MNISDFDYVLPKNLIAQKPVNPRDSCRLMIVDRKKSTITHTIFSKLPEYLSENDLLVFNNSKVIPARLYATKQTGGKVEILLLHKIKNNHWFCLTKPALKSKAVLDFNPKKALPENKEYKATVWNRNPKGITEIIFDFDLEKILNQLGHTPLPPYISKQNQKSSWYQTVYAKNPGSVAAPTAGLHFTKRLLQKLKQKGIKQEFITLHVGLGTFAPIKTKNIEDHKMHAELASISTKTAQSLNLAISNKQRIIAVGSTTTRLLEFAANNNHEKFKPFTGWVDNFIFPSYKFKLIQGMLTNFHLPKSSLLLMISAFANQKLIKQAYQAAIAQKYRFFSFGDCMLII